MNLTPKADLSGLRFSAAHSDSRFSILDVDECSDTDANDCDVNARCDNLPGSFDCTCAVGYAGDGKTSCVPAGRKTITAAVCQ